MSSKTYAGIGSRETPLEICSFMKEIAGFLCTMKYTLRSGGADGADAAFESGVANPFLKEIFLPWQNFNKNKSSLYVVSKEAYDMAEKFHPAWGSLSRGAQALIARNGHQILGRDMNTPVDFIICWTPKGALSGGTAQGIRIAKNREIPVFNLGKEKDFKFIKECLQTKQVPV